MTCNDSKCPIHGSIKVRGNMFTGIVTSAKSQRTITVERQIVRLLPKFERYKKSRSRLKAHLPDCIKVHEGDEVRIGETRKISKTKNFVVLEVTKKGAKSMVKTEELVKA